MYGVSSWGTICVYQCPHYLSTRLLYYFWFCYYLFRTYYSSFPVSWLPCGKLIQPSPLPPSLPPWACLRSLVSSCSLRSLHANRLFIYRAAHHPIALHCKQAPEPSKSQTSTFTVSLSLPPSKHFCRSLFMLIKYAFFKADNLPPWISFYRNTCLWVHHWSVFVFYIRFPFSFVQEIKANIWFHDAIEDYEPHFYSSPHDSNFSVWPRPLSLPYHFM